MKESISRRGFLGAGAAALGAAGVVGMGVVGCTPAADNPEKKDDKKVVNSVSELNPQEDYTACTTDFKPLFQELKIGNLTLKNRFVKSPAGSDTLTAKNDGDELNANYLDYYENFAKGGCSIVFLESAIATYYSVDAANRQLKGWLLRNLDTIPQRMKPVIDRVHNAGSYIGFQLAGGTVPMTAEDNEKSKETIIWLEDAMAEICVYLEKAGFDIIQIHTSAGQSIKNLLCPRFNKRVDEYGCQSVENRTRFMCELIKKIKKNAPSLAIQILMDAVEENDTDLGNSDGFITMEDSIANAKAFEAAGADTIYLRLSVPGRHVAQFAPDLMFSGYGCEGTNGFGPRANFKVHFDGMVDGSHSGAGLLLKCCEAMKKAVKIPVSAAGYMDPRTAPDLIANAVRDGKVDYLMMTRPLTVDPELPNKLQAGKRDEIAPCCRCMHCHNKGLTSPYGYSGPEWCRVNPLTQRAYTVFSEGYKIPTASAKKNIVVVGAGPAGLEAARTAALCGHTVTLLEKKSSLGGMINTAHAFKGDHERLGDLVAYFKRQMELRGVTVKTGVEADVTAIDAYKPDGVIVAVGGKRVSKLTAAGNIKVCTPDEAGSVTGDKIVICGAGLQAIDLALFFIAQGKSVYMINEGVQDDIGKEQSNWYRQFTIPYLYHAGMKCFNNCSGVKVTADGVQFVMGTGVQKTIACDTVIEAWDMVDNTDLYKACAAKYTTVAAGDCFTTEKPLYVQETYKNIAMAVRAGHVAGRSFN